MDLFSKFLYARIFVTLGGVGFIFLILCAATYFSVALLGWWWTVGIWAVIIWLARSIFFIFFEDANESEEMQRVLSSKLYTDLFPDKTSKK